MNDILKYSNIEEELPKLPKVLLNTIQADVLEVKRVDKTCEKYIKASTEISELKDAYYVVYSKYIDKSNHKYEKFIFLDEDGAEICDVSGIKLDLYGLISCTNLSLSEEYKASLSKQNQ
jgi:hypothetical protein